MKTNPQARRDNLIAVADRGRRLAELVDDPAVREWFELTRDGLITAIGEPERSFEDLREPVALLRALNLLEQMLRVRVADGHRADKTLTEKPAHE